MDERTAAEYKRLDLKQNAIKILINSIYGAFGNKYFYFFNPDIAQSITLQGQEQIKFTKKAIDHYFTKKWHKDTEVHEKLGISDYEIEKIPDDVECGIYIDTDSVYVNFEPAVNSVKGLELDDEEAMKFCIQLDKVRLAEYLAKALDKYGAMFNTENIQNFELENLSRRGIWLAKKNYMIEVCWEGEFLEKEDRYLVIKGLEMIKAQYPEFARERLKVLSNIILAKGQEIDVDEDLIKVMQKFKREALQLGPDELCMNFRIRKYEEYIIDEEEDLILEKGTSAYPRSAAFHNHFLYKHNMLSKYAKIRAGDKIKYYWVEPTEEITKHDGTTELVHKKIGSKEYTCDVFSYLPGKFPIEFAPKMDYDKQFFELIISPINRQLEVLGFQPLDQNLQRDVEIVVPKIKKPIPERAYYPLYVIDNETLEYVELPEQYNKYLDPKSGKKYEIDPSDFDGYLKYLTLYGSNTKIIPRYELQKYRQKRAKKLGISVDTNPDQMKLF